MYDGLAGDLFELARFGSVKSDPVRTELLYPRQYRFASTSISASRKMFVLVVLISLLLTYLLIKLGPLYLRNQKAFRFYAEKCPNLPTLPNPNPFSGHLLDLYMTDISWRVITGLHQYLGPTYGTFFADQPWVVTKDLELIKLIEIDEAKKHPNRAFFGGPLKNFNSSIFQIEGDDWRAARQVVAPALSNFHVKGKVMSSGIELIVERLALSLERKLAQRKANGEHFVELELRNTFERFTLAVIFLVSYNQTDMIDFDGEQDKWTEIFAKGARDGSSFLVKASMMFPFLRNILAFLSRYSPFGIWERSIVDYIQKAIDQKRLLLKQENESKLQPGDNLTASKSTHSKGSVFNTIIEGYLAKKLNYQHTIGSLFLLVLAGAITTADTLSCLIWQLAMNPDIQERLRKSIKEDGIESEFLTWCINETIRWHPAVPLGSGRVLGEDVSLNGLYLPKGTFVMPSTHAIHRDQNIWTEPDRFDPDRWRNQAEFHPAAFMGFGLGWRDCLGRYLAVHEIKLAVNMLLSRYRIEKCDRTPTRWRFKVPAMLYTIMSDPLIVRFTPLDGTD